MTKENWKLGKQPGTVITDSSEGFTAGTGHTDDSYYGGNLICESIGRKKDAELISAAPDLLASLHDAVLIMTLMGKAVPRQWHNALCKATGLQELNIDDRSPGLLKPHKDYDFVDNDKVFVKNHDGTVDYFMLYYEQEVAEWLLVQFTDKHFTKTLENGEGVAVAESLSAYGYEVLNRVEDYELEELP